MAVLDPQEGIYWYQEYHGPGKPGFFAFRLPITCLRGRRAKRGIMRGVGAATFNIKNDASGGTSFRKMHPPEMVMIK
jgi:hypothetical protein